MCGCEKGIPTFPLKGANSKVVRCRRVGYECYRCGISDIQELGQLSAASLDLS